MKNIKIYFFTLVFVPTFILSTILISGCGGSSSDSTSNILVFKAELNNQMQEMQNIRGYQSSQDYVLHFGLGKVAGDVNIRVMWPDGTQTKKTETRQLISWIFQNKPNCSFLFSLQKTLNRSTAKPVMK